MKKSIKGTQTELNLLKAFAGECQAKNRYELFAEKAKEEGTLVLNLIARRCAFGETKLAPFQAINDIKDPVEAQTKDGQDSIYLAMQQRIITEFKTN